MNSLQEPDLKFMYIALKEAEKSLPLDVPVGAIIVDEGLIIGRGHNLREKKGDPTLHAEIVAIRQAARRRRTWHLEDCILYVTLEPCPMCAGAILLARLKRVVFGAFDPKSGALGSRTNLNNGDFNHTFIQEGGLLEEKCATLLKEFFVSRRGG